MMKALSFSSALISGGSFSKVASMWSIIIFSLSSWSKSFCKSIHFRMVMQLKYVKNLQVEPWLRDQFALVSASPLNRAPKVFCEEQEYFEFDQSYPCSATNSGHQTL
jgi:hypothetical protein